MRLKDSPCGFDGCPVITASTYCPKHRPVRRRSPSSRVTGHRSFKRLRPSVLQRGGFRCIRCGYTETRAVALSNKSRLQVDHKVPVVDGGAPLDRANLQVMCDACNNIKGAR